MTNETANATWNQISVATKMACGAREVAYDSTGLRFKVGGRQRWIEIELDASDTYTVRLVRVHKYERIVVEEHSDVYADQLSECVYHACNK